MTNKKWKTIPFCLPVARYMVGGGQTGLTWEARTGEAMPLRLPRGDVCLQGYERTGVSGALSFHHDKTVTSTTIVVQTK